MTPEAAETASRVIMWNVGHIGNTIAMYGFLLLATIIGLNGIWRQAELWVSGKPAPEYLSRYWRRFSDIFTHGFVQKGVVRDGTIALAHTLVYIGFLALLFTTTMVLIDHDFGIPIYQGKFYLAVTLLSDILGFGVLLGIAAIAKRRYVDNPDRLHNKLADASFIIVITLLVLQGFVVEGLRIHVTDDPWAAYSPVGLLFAKFFWFLSDPAAKTLHYIMWWFHTLTVFAVVALTPYTKFFHIIASSLNLYFKSSGRAKGQLKSPGDLEQMIEQASDDFTLGVDSIEDYSWKQLMDLDACTSCGRCQNACPAYQTGKPLSPKWLILDSRNHALGLMAKGELGESIVPKVLQETDRVLTEQFFLKSSGVVKTDGAYHYDKPEDRSQTNPAVQNSVLSLAASADQSMSGSVMDKNVFWSCTTCYACVNACPVGINHVDQIIENRRNMVMMRGDLPSEAQATLRTLETQANPYGDASTRSNWLKDLDVKILKPGEQVDYLYWVGCVSAFDQRKQKIAQSLVAIMNKAGLSFGVLGNEEKCTGDPARRLGEENLFQSLAKQNIATLQNIKFKTLVANCPHCFNTIKNEYPDFGNISDHNAPVIHHSQLIQELLDEEKIVLDKKAEDFTFHDPCYLGRYNDEYEAPRDAVRKATGLNILEMKDNKSEGLCCGAGGGHFWMDLKQGERVNKVRAEQAAATGAKNIATACPFCLQMMEDGTKMSEEAKDMNVADIAEVIAERI